MNRTEIEACARAYCRANDLDPDKMVNPHTGTSSPPIELWRLVQPEYYKRHYGEVEAIVEAANAR